MDHRDRTSSHTIEILRLYGGAVGDPHIWGDFRKANGRIVTVKVNPTFKGICMAVGFVGTGGRNIS